MTDAAEDEADVRRLVRAVFPVRAKQAHWVPDRPYQPTSPWPVDPARHRRVLLDDSPDDELVGATAQSNHVALPYRCRLCHEGLTAAAIETHHCQDA